MEPDALERRPERDDEEHRKALANRVNARTRWSEEGEAVPSVRFRCQNTEIPRATIPLRTFDPRPYVREFTNGNVSLRTFLRVAARAAIREPMRKLGLVPEIPVKGKPGGTAKKTEALHLQPGDRVQVKSRAEIEDNLDEKGRNKGLWFDLEMLPYSEGPTASGGGSRASSTSVRGRWSN